MRDYFMTKKRLIVMSVISITLVSMLMIGSTYSVFVTRDTDEEINVYKTGNLDVTYTLSDDNIVLGDKEPVNDSDVNAVSPYRITVTNNGTVPYMFDLILEDSTAGEVIDYQYIMTKVGNLDNKSLADCENNVIKNDVILSAGESIDIDVRLWLSDEVKNTEINKSFFAKLTVDGIAIYDDNSKIDNSMLSLVYMNGFAAMDDYSYFKSDLYRDKIRNVSFVKDMNITEWVVSWDMSLKGDNSVVAYLVNSDVNGYYDLYIVSEQVIFSNDLSFFFSGMLGIESISFDNLDTSLTTDMSYMFAGVDDKKMNLKEVVVSSFNTSNVINMAYMFYNCDKLKALDVSAFNTSNVTNMAYMFYGCSSLSELDISNFETKNVINMSYMFYNCVNLVELDVSSFDTSKVIDMSYIFAGSGDNTMKLAKLNLSKFNTSKVIDMEGMFYNCANLTTVIQIMNSGVTSYKDMFKNAALEGDANIIIDYVSDVSLLVDNMIATGGSDSKIIKRSLIEG